MELLKIELQTDIRVMKQLAKAATQRATQLRKESVTQKSLTTRRKYIYFAEQLGITAGKIMNAVELIEAARIVDEMEQV